MKSSKDVPPLVSVVILSFNRQAYIGEAIESVIEQRTEYIFEIIVSDDFSTDDTVEKVRDVFGDQLRIILATENRGIAANRNAAIRSARGKYIVFLDDDDRMLPGRIQEQISFLERHPEIGIALGLCVYEDGSRPPGDYFARRGMQIPWRDWQVFDDWRPILLKHYVGSPGASAYRRELFDHVGLFNESFRVAEDNEWLARAARKTSLACFNGPVTWVRTSHNERQTTSILNTYALPDLFGHILRTIDDLTSEEIAIVAPRYNSAVKGSLDIALRRLGRSRISDVLDRHSQALDSRTRFKWRLVSLAPLRLARGILVCRDRIRQRTRPSDS